MTYPGGKAGAGTFQTIINLIPPHRVYIEPFIGGGAVMRFKRPASLNIGIDLDASVLRVMEASIVGNGVSAGILAVPGATTRSDDARSASGDFSDGRRRDSFHVAIRYRWLNQDAVAFLEDYDFTGQEFVYCDPPYLMSTRSGRRMYEHEFDDRQHRRLLRVIRKIAANVMISGYWSKLYTEELRHWRSISYQSMTRGGKPATEWLWMNYADPVALHDYRYLGKNFRERERIKRKKRRWVNRLRKMATLERRALLSAIDEAWSTIVGNGEIGSSRQRQR